MNANAKMAIARIEQKFGDVRRIFGADVIDSLVAAECFYVMRAQDDSIPYDRVKAVTNETFEQVMAHYGATT